VQDLAGKPFPDLLGQGCQHLLAGAGLGATAGPPLKPAQAGRLMQARHQQSDPFQAWHTDRWATGWVVVAGPDALQPSAPAAADGTQVGIAQRFGLFGPAFVPQHQYGLGDLLLVLE